ncbi:hypothetical protein DR085_00355 [Mycoplasma flocculare]|nr:hypothetical protein [Mesomycoplasma flocculare]
MKNFQNYLKFKKFHFFFFFWNKKNDTIILELPKGRICFGFVQTAQMNFFDFTVVVKAKNCATK